MPRTQTKKQATIKRLRRDTGLEPITQREPWRYNKDLGEDERWDIFQSLVGFSMGVQDSLEMECFWPGKKELPEEGSWVWCIRPPHTTVEATFGALYFARPYTDSETYGWRRMKYSVTVYTQNGEVRMWPYEYAHPDTTEMIEFWAEGAFEFHPFDEALSAVELTERLFYVTSRGIPMVEALPMVLGDIKAPVGWFEIKP